MVNILESCMEIGMAQLEDERPVLSPAEWRVMTTLWEQGELDARGVYSVIADEREWAYQTVKTLLSRLVAKGAVEYDQVGNSYLYRPAVPREEMTRQEVRSVIDRVVGAAVSPVLAHFINEAELSEEDIQKLQKLLDEKRKKRSGGRRGGRGRTS